MAEDRVVPLRAIALTGALAALAVHAAGGFPMLSDPGTDNDSALRLVQVRDLLAGQGWFDPMQYRMGPAGGFAMHWSRLVDAPIALLIALVEPLLGRNAAEAVAAIAWPSLLFAASLAFIVQATRMVAGNASTLPAAIIGAVTLHLTGLFAPGVLDHHNVQLTLTLGMAACLARPDAGWRTGALAGTCAALMLAVGMETLPLVAAAGGVVALSLLIDGRRNGSLATGYGLGFAGSTGLAMLATVAPSRWTTATCDALSSAQTLPALVGGLGLAAIAFVAGRRSIGVRAAALAGLGLGLAIIAAFMFPACLADPYAGLPERLRSLWLEGIDEARSAGDLWREEPQLMARFYVTPLLALIICAFAAARRTMTRGDMAVAVLLTSAFLVSLWQVRGSHFAVPLAVIPLAGWVTRWRARQETSGTAMASARALLAWAVSFNLVWGAAAVAATSVIERPSSAKPGGAAAAAPLPPCTARAAFAELASMPASTVLVISNLGAPALLATPHHVLAGPYHRNIAGNLAALDIWLTPPDGAEAMVRDAGIDMIAVCRTDPETAFLSAAAKDGLLATLARGKAPAWLEPIGKPTSPLLLWRVR